MSGTITTFALIVNLRFKVARTFAGPPKTNDLCDGIFRTPRKLLDNKRFRSFFFHLSESVSLTQFNANTLENTGPTPMIVAGLGLVKRYISFS